MYMDRYAKQSRMRWQRSSLLLILLLAVAFMLIPTINKFLQERKITKKLDIDNVEAVD